MRKVELHPFILTGFPLCLTLMLAPVGMLLLPVAPAMQGHGHHGWLRSEVTWPYTQAVELVVWGPDLNPKTALESIADSTTAPPLVSIPQPSHQPAPGGIFCSFLLSVSTLAFQGVGGEGCLTVVQTDAQELPCSPGGARHLFLVHFIDLLRLILMPACSIVVSVERRHAAKMHRRPHYANEGMRIAGRVVVSVTQEDCQ